MSQENSAGPKKEDGEDESRRDFLKSALAVGTVLVIAGIGAVTKSLWTPSAAPTGGFPRVKVANVSDLHVNNYVTFDYPLVGESNMIVKLGQRAEGGVGPDGDIVAFSLICQHLGCTVGYRAKSAGAPGPVEACPCHGSIFDLVDSGKVLSGPAPRNMPQVTLQLDESTGDIYAVGMGPPTIFGHDTGSKDVSYDLQGGTPVSSS